MHDVISVDRVGDVVKMLGFSWTISVLLMHIYRYVYNFASVCLETGLRDVANVSYMERIGILHNVLRPNLAKFLSMISYITFQMQTYTDPISAGQSNLSPLCR